jgi:hypothetical protein
MAAAPTGLSISPASVALFSQQLEQAGDEVVEVTTQALYAEAEAMIVDSVPLVPWETGVLAGSHFVDDPETSGAGASVTFGYGGAANAYAWVQHEHEEYMHPNGGQAKYFSVAIEQHEANLDERLADFVKSRINL